MNTEETKIEYAEMARQAAATEAACAKERPAHVPTPENSFFLSFPHFEAKKVWIGFLMLAAFAAAEFGFCLL